MKKLALFSLFFCITATALRADSIVEEIIARVNNQIITRSEYQREQEQLKQEVQQQDPGNADKVLAERKKDVLRGLIDNNCCSKKAKIWGSLPTRNSSRSSTKCASR